MPLSPTRSWTLFRAVRVLIYSIATLACIGIAAIYAVLLIRGWASYKIEQRAIGITLLVIYAISTVMMYSMLIFRFHLWADGARLILLILAQVGGTVAFDLFYPSLPCNNLGTESTCKIVERVAIFGGWSLSGLLLLFALYMASMHYVPMPTPRQNPEALLALQLLSDKKESQWRNEKRSSMKSVASASSVYSQQSHITPYPYTPPPGSGNDQYRPQSPAYSPSVGRMDTQRSPANNQYRPQSPAYSPRAGSPQGQYRVQDPGYARASRQPNGQFLSQPSMYNVQSAGPQYTPGQDMTMLAPPFDGNRPGTPGSLRLAEPTNLGPQINRPAPTYDYNRSGTPIARASDFNRSRTPGGSMESDGSASGRGLQDTRRPPFEYYRSVTPAMSMRSVALTNASSIRTAPRQRYYQNNGIPAPTPLSATDRKPSLTLTFFERAATPMSPALSSTSFYMPLKPQVSAPPGLAPVGPGFKFQQPPLNTQNGSPISPLSQPSPVVPPVALQLRQVLRDADSPSVYSPHSADTLFMPRTAALSSSVPRSPSPQAVSFPNLPPTALSAALPARPELSPALYIGRYGTPAPGSQRQLYGSPDISASDSPTLGNEHYQSDFRREQPDRTLTGSPADDRITSVSQWRQKLEARRI